MTTNEDCALSQQALKHVGTIAALTRNKGYAMRCRSYRCCGIALIAVSLCWLRIASAQEPRPTGEQSIAELIQQLGSRVHKDRELATRVLTSRDDALPALRKAAREGDAEVARRSREIMTSIFKRQFNRCVEYGKHGRVDVLTEWLVECRDLLRAEEYWQGVTEVGHDLLKRSNLRENNRILVGKQYWEHFLPTTFAEYQKFSGFFYTELPVNSTIVPRLQNAVFILRSNQAVTGHEREAVGCMMTCTNSIKLDGGVGKSIVFVNGDVTLGGELDRCVVVADGNVRIRSGGGCVVLARGNIQIREVPRNLCSLIHCGGRFSYESFPDAKSIKDVLGSDIQEGKRHPLDFVCFFETADVGVEAAGSGQVAIKSLQQGSPLAQAGLKVDDVIVALDGARITDPEALRRHLRRAFVRDAAQIEILRSGKPLIVDVSFLGWRLPSDPIKASQKKP